MPSIKNRHFIQKIDMACCEKKVVNPEKLLQILGFYPCKMFGVTIIIYLESEISKQFFKQNTYLFDVIY